jgi:hypothetical protein
MWVLAVCIVALAVISAVAGIPRRLAGRRLLLRKGGEAGRDTGLDDRDRDADRRADVAVHRRRTLTVASRLMPPSAGRRWLAEAESLLTEVPAARRRAAVRSHLLSAPRLAVMLWARQVLRRTRRGPRRPG